MLVLLSISLSPFSSELLAPLRKTIGAVTKIIFRGFFTPIFFFVSAYLESVCFTNFDQQDKEEEDEADDSESNSPFKLSKWEIMDKEEKMGKFIIIINKIF